MEYRTETPTKETSTATQTAAKIKEITMVLTMETRILEMAMETIMGLETTEILMASTMVTTIKVIIMETITEMVTLDRAMVFLMETGTSVQETEMEMATITELMTQKHITSSSKKFIIDQIY